MKNKIKTMALLAAILLLSACDKQDVASPDASKTREVTFKINALESGGQTPMRAPTRAIAAPTYLLVLDEFGGSIVAGNTVERTTDALENLTLSLTYGQHTLYFVAAKNCYDSYNTTAMTATWTGNADHKLNYVWATKVVLDVNENTPANQAVTLALAVAQVQVQCNDAFPANTGNMAVTAETGSWTLNLRTLQGVTSEVSTTANVSSYAGQTGKTMGFFTFIPASGNIGDLTITVYNNAQTPEELASHTLEDVPVRLGYVSHYAGLFFSRNQPFSFTFEDDWKGTDEYTY